MVLQQAFFRVLFFFAFGCIITGCNPKGIKYMALGDSYTIGENVKESQRFPNQLAKMLNDNGVSVVLGTNPARTGWTTQNLIDNELKIYRAEKPKFATLLIGVNDWVQQVPEATFRKNFVFILQEMLKELPAKNRLVVVTIPDFSATPEGAKYGKGRNISEGIQSFNTIIAEECAKAGVAVIDIYPATQQMKGNATLIAEDGLHPSGMEYKIWAELILPQALKVLKK